MMRIREDGFAATAVDALLRAILIVNLVLIAGFFISPYKLLVIRSDSMDPELQVGSVVIAEKVSEDSELKVGDIVTYKNPDIPFTITHRIIQVTEDGFVLKGDNLEKADGVVKREWLRYRIICGSENSVAAVFWLVLSPF